MTGIPLFIAEPTGTCRMSLRRLSMRPDGEHWHDASAVIDDDASVTPPDENGRKSVTDGRVAHDDPRWPVVCECGYGFAETDTWQVNELDWYEGGGHRFAWGIGSWDGPAGAMIRSPWRDDPDRPAAWTIFLPNGSWWCTNDPSSGEGNKLGPKWTVTGEAPNLTVSPSIDDRGSRPWHGWIRDGMLVDA